MHNKIIILQHTSLVTPGYFTQLMEEDLVETKIIRLDKGEKIPSNLNAFDGMLCLGGPMDTWMEDKYPWMIEEKNKITDFVLNKQKPYLGICLGCQFLGEILGGKVIKSNPPEIGVFNINILEGLISLWKILNYFRKIIASIHYFKIETIYKSLNIKEFTFFKLISV